MTHDHAGFPCTIGVSLSGGGARGIAHIGVLGVLEDADVPIHLFTGTSAGGIVGALYAAGRSPSEMEEIVSSIRLLDIVQRKAEGPGLLGREKTAHLLAEVLGGDITFDDLILPLGLVAVDVDTGEEIVIRDGSVVEGVLATTAVPGVFPPQPWRGRYLIDGGVTNPLPCDAARAMGADRIIAVHTKGRFPQASSPSPPGAAHESGSFMHALLHRSRWNHLLDVLERSLCIMTEELVTQRLAQAPPDVMIEVLLSNVATFDLSKLDICLRAGQAAARTHMAELSALREAALGTKII